MRLIVDPSGQDASARPNAPSALAARAVAAGGCLLSWSYRPAGQGGWPTVFNVFLTAGASANYAVVAATVPFVQGQLAYSCQLAGLMDGSTYTAAVRASNGTAAETNTSAVASVTGDSTPPSNVDALTASPTFSSQ